MYDPVIGMKGTENNAALVRGAVSNLWRNTLSRIPSVFGRLVYISSLRNSNNGRYEHHGLTLVYGEDQANRALKKSHAETFAEWLTFNLEQQKADLELYISTLPDEPRQVIQTWLKLAPYRNLIPTAVRGVERKVYISDLNVVLELLKNAYAAGDPGRGASRSQ
ncbi:MAG: hypothetical protein LAP38_09650 [Acidobacteriia bacterium]|nr:hypothetical protein [Terriglobia bacterium]